MKKIITVAIVAAALNVQAEPISNLEIFTPGVNLDEEILYWKTTIPKDECAYGGRMAIKPTIVGLKAFDVVMDLHREGTPIGELSYDVIIDEYGKNTCWVYNVRKADYE